MAMWSFNCGTDSSSIYVTFMIYYSVILTVLSFMLISVYSANLSKSIGESIGIAIAILFKFGIGIGIANTFTRKYWYWYCQYFFPVLLTALNFDVFNT